MATLANCKEKILTSLAVAKPHHHHHHHHLVSISLPTKVSSSLRWEDFVSYFLWNFLFENIVQRSHCSTEMAPKPNKQDNGPAEADPPADQASNPDCPEENDKAIAKGGVTTPFPWKLHHMLDDMDAQDNKTIVCWQPHGRAFMVNKPKEFVEEIMPHYFNQTKYASFQRQLNLYGFSRLSHGRDKGAYYHKCFVRGERALCRGMVRQKIKGTKVRRSLSPEEEPDFYSSRYRETNQATDRQVPQVMAMDTSPIARSSPPPPPPPSLPRKKSPSSRRQPKREPTTGTSLVALMKDTSHKATSIVLPPPPIIKPLQAPRRVVPPVARKVLPPRSVKGGDLLFFEGRPFRYLEHLEQVPPAPLSDPTYGHRDNLHDMITSIVSMETSWTDGRNGCAV